VTHSELDCFLHFSSALRVTAFPSHTTTIQTILLIFTVITLASQPVTAWGDVGHRAVAYPAEKYFTDAGSRLVDELLANDQGFDISDAATWANTIK
jgi:hypothetical protein